MIGYDMSKFSLRRRTAIYSLFSPEGKKRILNLLQAELQLYSKFELNYTTPELRKLERKVEKGTATEEEKLILSKNSKEFEGRVKGGGLVTELKAIDIIRKHIKAIPSIKDDIAKLSAGSEDASRVNADIILGHPVSYWNLNPAAISYAAFEQMFDAPEFVLSELEKLIKPLVFNGVVTERTPVFSNISEITELLEQIKLESYYDKALFLLRSIKPLDQETLTTFKADLIELVKYFINVDKDFDMETYNLVEEYLPNYNNQKLRYFLTLLHQNNDSDNVVVSSRVNITTLYALYRKADELCQY